MISSVFKRDGKIVSFNPSRITRGIIKAMNAVGAVNESLAVKLTDEVISKLKGEPSVEAVQNIIEDVLIGNKLLSVSKAYALYREKRAKVREVKFFLGVDDDLKLSINSIKVLAERYLLRDSSNNIIETPRGLFLRVAKNVSKAEVKYGSDVSAMESAFFGMMSNLEFLPNSPALMNAGTSMNQLAACFVLPVNDSLESIFNAVKESAVIHHSGGGTGFNFSNLRPNGDMVISTHGVASGPVGFIKIFDVTTSVIKQGGRRRGANMALLNCNHPDVIEFINAKRDGGYVNFNFSVSLTDSFMKKVLAGGSYPLINPKDGSHVCVVKARDVFNEIVSNAWTNGDPGVIFIDEINKHHPLKERISAV
ncbi:MAG TPA: ribonucleotide reductase N-terminal alpha domain-containing protein, partial [Candidatus Nanoarchaeia archaeon]|nr:ribonucleotide reductase N-terminal alpha domain-containing protein [Candidatus Nanoarchaeia archaeon]